jgi:hypothetical protein
VKRFSLHRPAPKVLTEPEPCVRCQEPTAGRDATVDADGRVVYRPLCAGCRRKRYRLGRL